jgi:uncharacterized OsmC-like protein
MNRDELRAIQAPLKQRYRDDPAGTIVILKAEGKLGDGLACSVDTGRALIEAGLHPSTGGSGAQACSGDMLLQALVACAGVTLATVATSLGIRIQDANLTAQGEFDPRGTLGVSKDAPVGLRNIRLTVSLDSDASAEQKAKLIELTERYCVVYQTLRNGVDVSLSYA